LLSVFFLLISKNSVYSGYELFIIYVCCRYVSDLPFHHFNGMYFGKVLRLFSVRRIRTTSLIMRENIKFYISNACYMMKTEPLLLKILRETFYKIVNNMISIWNIFKNI
jgi:hypothetical protein